MTRFNSEYRFSDLTEKDAKSWSDVEAMGVDIWTRLFERDKKYGGYTCFFVGSPGQGKTSAELTILDTTLSDFSDELCLWAEPHGIPIQFLHSKAAVRILVDRSFPLQLYRFPEDEGRLELSDDYKLKYFDGPSDALRKCEHGVTNAIYFHPDKIYNWVRIINRFRFDNKWENVFFDEAESVFPLRVKGKAWHMGEKFSDTFKELRKSRVNLFFNSQQRSDIDHRVIGKINVVGYFRGARVDKYGPVWQRSIHKLHKGQAYLVLDNCDFGTLQFQKFEPRTPEYTLKLKGE